MSVLRDGVFLGSALAIVAGFYLIHQSAGWVCGGMFGFATWFALTARAKA